MYEYYSIKTLKKVRFNQKNNYYTFCTLIIILYHMYRVNYINLYEYKIDNNHLNNLSCYI